MEADIVPPVETCADHLRRILLADRSPDLVCLSLDHPRIPRHSWTQAPAARKQVANLNVSGEVRRQRTIIRETTTQDVTLL